MISNKDKNKFLEELEKNPIIQIACRKTGIGKATYYRWIKEDKNFKEETEESLNKGRLLINDLAESKLISSISNNNLTAIIYWLKNNHSRYSEKVDLLDSKEQKKFVKRFLLSNQKTACQILSEITLNKQLSKQTLNIFKYINSQINNNKKASTDDKAKMIDNFVINEVTVETPKWLQERAKEINSQRYP